MPSQGGTLELWGQFLTVHSLTTILYILLLHLDFFHSSPMVLVWKKQCFFPECKAAATGSCHVMYVPGGVNVSLSAHQIFWEQGLMFLAFKTHFLSSWAKWKIFIVQTHTFADLLPLYCNYFKHFPNCTDLERSKLAGGESGEVWEGKEGEWPQGWWFSAWLRQPRMTHASAHSKGFTNLSLKSQLLHVELQHTV